jgi:hypothetical protein
MHLLAPAVLLCASLLVAETLISTSAAAAVPSALGLVALAVLTSVITTRPSLGAVLFGAAAAVLYALLRPIAPPLAGAAYLALVLAPRTLRTISLAGGAIATALGLAMGALAAMTIATSLHASAERMVGALFLASSFVALPLTVPADDVRTGALRSIAARSRGPARHVLLRAIALRRRLERALHRPSRDERGALDAAFVRLTELGEARAAALAGGGDLEGAMRAKLDAIVGCMRALDRRAATHDRLDASADQRLADRRVDVENEVRALAELDR